jgi:hypothetical protein
MLGSMADADEHTAVDPSGVGAREETGITRVDAPSAESGITRRGDATTAGALLALGAMIDHYRVEERLGGGGMGTVYLAHDTQLGRRVALKMVRPDLLGSERALESFLFEVRATARFNHPNIVTVYGAGDHEGMPYVALEYVDGVDLARRLRQGSLPRGEALAILLSVAEALCEAHQRGVVHRDLKPANVMLPSDGRVRVVDFGLAKAYVPEDGPPSAQALLRASGQLTRAGAGTPRYMAPEQWRGEEVGSPADMWSFGVMLYEIIAGVRLFDAETEEELVASVCFDASVPEVPDDVPEALASLMRACLARDAAARPTAPQAVAALRGLTAMAPVAAPPGETRAPSRSLAPWVGAALALGAGVAIGTVGRPVGEVPSAGAHPAVVAPFAEVAASTPALLAPSAPLASAAPATSASAHHAPLRAPRPFPRNAAQGAVQVRLLGANGACRSLPGTRHVAGSVVFDPATGAAGAITFLASAARDMTGWCVQGLLRGVHVQPYDPPAESVPFTVSLQPQDPP